MEDFLEATRVRANGPRGLGLHRDVNKVKRLCWFLNVAVNLSVIGEKFHEGWR